MKKKHGDHPKVHHPVRPQPFLHDWVGAFLSREKKLNTQEYILFVLITCLLLLMTWEQRVGTLLRALQTPLYKLPFFLYRCVICCQNSYKDTEIHKEEARTRCKTVGMPAWYAWPARSCITAPFALRKTKIQLPSAVVSGWGCVALTDYYRCSFPQSVHFLYTPSFPGLFCLIRVLDLTKREWKKMSLIPFATSLIGKGSPFRETIMQR